MRMMIVTRAVAKEKGNQLFKPVKLELMKKEQSFVG